MRGGPAQWAQLFWKGVYTLEKKLSKFLSKTEPCFAFIMHQKCNYVVILLLSFVTPVPTNALCSQEKAQAGSEKCTFITKVS